jgi:hypothetical protein
MGNRDMPISKTEMSSSFFDYLIRYRWAVILFNLVVTVLLSTQIKPEFDNSLRIWFLDDDPDVHAYNEFLQFFNTDEFVAVAVEFEDVFTHENLSKLDQLTHALGNVEGVLSATSIVNAETVRTQARGEGEDQYLELQIGQLSYLEATRQEELEQLREATHEDRLLSDLVSEADDAALIFLQIRHHENLAPKMLLAREVQRLCREILPEDTVHVAGSAVIDEAMNRLSITDMKQIIPMIGLLGMILTYILFRSVWATIMPSVVVLLTMVCTLGVAGLFETKLNIITSVLFPLIMAICTAGCVHLISGIREGIQNGKTQDEALKQSFLDLALPCTMTAVTTAAGLIALVVTPLEPLRQFGWMGAVGAFIALYFTLTVIPLAFSFLPAPKHDPKFKERALTRGLSSLTRLAWNRPRGVVCASMILICVGLVGATKIEAGADFSRIFKPDDPAYMGADYVDRNLGGTLTLEVLVNAEDVREPQVLSGFENLETYFNNLNSVGSTISPSSLVKLLHERWFGDPEYYRIPDTISASVSLLERLRTGDSPNFYDTYIGDNETRGRLSARISATELRALVDQSENHELAVSSAFPAGVQARLTGLGKLVINLDGFIIESQIKSLSLAFIVITLVICLMFRSVKFGLYALIPNATPVILVLGMMGWTGMLLDVATVMCGSILLGLVVDDTVHFLARLRLEEERGELEGEIGLKQALFRCGVGTGRALITTTLILSSGFFLLLFAGFRVNQIFGVVCGSAICFALICDLLVLPAVIRWLFLRSSEARAKIS